MFIGPTASRAPGARVRDLEPYHPNVGWPSVDKILGSIEEFFLVGSSFGDTIYFS